MIILIYYVQSFGVYSKEAQLRQVYKYIYRNRLTKVLGEKLGLIVVFTF